MTIPPDFSRLPFALRLEHYPSQSHIAMFVGETSSGYDTWSVVPVWDWTKGFASYVVYPSGAVAEKLAKYFQEKEA